MTKLAAAAVIFCGSLVAVSHSPDTPSVATPSAAMPEKRPKQTPRAARSQPERLPLRPAVTVRPLARPQRESVHPQPAPTSSSPWTTLESTAYCATGSRNAAGNWPTVGTVAANGYPLGTRLEVRGRGVVTVEDRSAVGATQLDFYLGEGAACEQAAAAWGRRPVEVREAA